MDTNRQESSSPGFLTKAHDLWLTHVLGVDSWNVSFTPARAGRTGAGEMVGATGPEFCTARVATHDVQSVRRLNELGFFVVDTALTFECDPHLALTWINRSVLAESRWDVVDATTKDADSMAAIAASALTTSRFHLDPEIPEVKASTVKSEWARNLALGQRGIQCRVVRGAVGVEGFLGVGKCRGGQRTLAIDLIAVRPESQRNGVGTALVRDFLELAQAQDARVRVGTQAANVSAVRFYETLGFTLTSSSYVMHAHSSTADPS